MFSNMKRFAHSITLAMLVLGFFGQAVMAAKTAGCNKAAGIATGTQTITVGGKTRQYIIRVPNGYDSSRGYKLIFGLHWRGGTMQDVATGQTVTRDVWVRFPIFVFRKVDI